MLEDKPFLGTGWGFPPTFSKSKEPGVGSTAGVELVSAREDIDQSLGILLSTSLGERMLQPQYGCNLRDYIFEPMNPSMIGFIQNLVENAILYYEPRIKAKKVLVTHNSDEYNQGILRIEVEYFIRETNSRFNFVYDFYLREGVGIVAV